VRYSQTDQNKAYIHGLLQNLSAALDRWIVNGSLTTRTMAYNIYQQIQRESMDEELVKQATRMANRAGMPLNEPPASKHSNLGENDANVKQRLSEAEERKQWESERNTDLYSSKNTNKPNNGSGRSALSNRMGSNSKPDIFMPKVGKGLDPKKFADSKKGLQDELAGETLNGESKTIGIPEEEIEVAAAKTSEIVAKSGAGRAFEGNSLGIGGLDDVLSQVKRRIWVPLAAPPSLLKELGINPVRGLLLYGLPGCGKTLLARSLGTILSPTRPLTVVSGPEIMDKFVGSSEANLRQIFDSPPEIYDTYRIGTKDNGAALSKAALHVIVLDEFDAMARSRGGRGKGDQGDAGVARDSVVNQLLAKMDGVDPLIVPTLVIGLTNKRSLIEPALLRPGRFEVQIEVPKPKTVAQRVSILNVHMRNMYQSGRVLVRDAPDGTAATSRIKLKGAENLPTYDELLDFIAVKCDDFSGASLAGVARAAASRALERAVCDFAGHFEEDSGEKIEGSSIADCLVTKLDFELAIEDVIESSKGGDGGEADTQKEDSADSEEAQ